ncbi:formate dehydrogenase subunit delta [Novosphingobium lentum]|uniref:formate dehydrogenase subunit delta n=1 Tax=Novosphingobium lentum TaxID=145287 RepID=UPI000AEF4EA2|nr:formate dehydrogenase subunit delta [Novosphingobium lentum]
MSSHTPKTTGDKLVYMANQIALNLALDDNPVAATADHIAHFWDPRMKAMIFADDRSRLSPIARDAIAVLARGHEPTSQTRATDPQAHGTDAG